MVSGGCDFVTARSVTESRGRPQAPAAKSMRSCTRRMFSGKFCGPINIFVAEPLRYNAGQSQAAFALAKDLSLPQSVSFARSPNGRRYRATPGVRSKEQRLGSAFVGRCATDDPCGRRHE